MPVGGVKVNMICFEIYINGKKTCTAGVDSEYGVLSTMLTWLRRDLNEFPAESRGDIQAEELKLDVSGHKSHGKKDVENLKWISKSLSVGDDINIKIIESEKHDAPESKRRHNRRLSDGQRRKYLEKLNKE